MNFGKYLKNGGNGIKYLYPNASAEILINDQGTKTAPFEAASIDFFSQYTVFMASPEV